MAKYIYANSQTDFGGKYPLWPNQWLKLQKGGRLAFTHVTMLSTIVKIDPHV